MKGEFVYMIELKTAYEKASTYNKNLGVYSCMDCGEFYLFAMFSRVRYNEEEPIAANLKISKETGEIKYIYFEDFMEFVEQGIEPVEVDITEIIKQFEKRA